jgi:hypothetical protein
MSQRNHLLNRKIKKNQWLRLLYITTPTTQRNNNHQGKGMNDNKLTMDQHGTRNATSMEAHGGLKAMHGDVRITQRRHGSQEEIKIKLKESP